MSAYYSHIRVIIDESSAVNKSAKVKRIKVNTLRAISNVPKIKFYLIYTGI